MLFRESKVRLVKSTVPWAFVDWRHVCSKVSSEPSILGHSGCSHPRLENLIPTSLVPQEELDQINPTSLSLPLEQAGGEPGLMVKLGGEVSSVAQFLSGPHRECSPASFPARRELCWSRCRCPGAWVWFRGVSASFVAANLTQVF